ncbi:MAG TPA: class I SAM-dependent methyltransferase [Xanthomonadaceae bacterium]|jgi:SAM-dependent methyltransferase|nr:class I SAM-dependent methyltransferase [Xanthomonadaceae bacterium]
MPANVSNFKDHFSGHAAVYAAARPHYPADLFDWLSRACAARNLAWDAGCGNGQASHALARHFEQVYASDPSAEQIAAAEPAPNIRYVVEAAEHCGLGDASADLVCVAQAMHWFDVLRFQTEARRVLKPGGVFAAWTYAQSRVSPTIDVVFDRFHDELLEGYWPAGREHVIDSYRNLPFAFGRIDNVPAFAMHCDWTLIQYLAYLRSWSACQRYLRATGNDAVAMIDADLSAAWGDPTQVRAVTWPLTLHVGRV